jgi:hypothetical protein
MVVNIEEVTLLIKTDYGFALDEVLQTLHNAEFEKGNTKILDYESKEVASIRYKHNQYKVDGVKHNAGGGK